MLCKLLLKLHLPLIATVYPVYFAVFLSAEMNVNLAKQPK